MSFQRANKGPKVLERLRKKLCEQESLLLLMSPSMHLRVHHKNGKVTARPHGVGVFVNLGGAWPILGGASVESLFERGRGLGGA